MLALVVPGKVQFCIPLKLTKVSKNFFLNKSYVFCFSVLFCFFFVRDPDLVKRIGQATALEARATGIPYVFAPCVAVIRNYQSL